MNQVLGIRPASNQRAGHFGRIFQNRGNKTNQGPLKGAKRLERISFRASTLSLPFFPHSVYRRIKPTPTFHPPPRNRGEEWLGKAKASLGGPQTRWGPRLRGGIIFQILLRSEESLRGESRAPPLGGLESPKQKQGVWLGFASAVAAVPVEAQGWGGGAAPLAGGRAGSRMKPGL